jgi:hypothetical protein
MYKMVKKSDGRDGYRSFTVEKVGKHGSCKTKGHGGRFVNKTPAGAARKAFSEFCRTKRIRGVCTLIVTIRETTSGKSGKLFTYKLNRMKLKDPVIRLEGTPNEYVIEYSTKVKSVSGGVALDCTKKGQTRGRALKRTIRKNRMRPNNVRRSRNRKSRK